MKKEKVKKITSIGGQALIEGIMMIGPSKIAVSGRTLEKTIYTEFINKNFLRDNYEIFKLPLLRGCVGIIDSVRVGYKALMLSAEKSGLEEAESSEPSKFDKWLDKVLGDRALKIITSIASMLGLAISIALFLLLPIWIFNQVVSFLPQYDSIFYRSIFEGILRIIIFVLYIFLCSSVGHMKRVFQYHGAEHKTIFCYESEEELTVENVKKHLRFHPRCGTSFIIIMLIIGMFIGLFIPFTNPFWRAAVKILFIPIIVGIGYEIIKICSKHDNIITRIISAPGLWMQRITTKEPDDEMIEVAITALKAVIPENGEDIISK